MRPTPRFLQPLLAALALSFLLAVSGCSSENPSYAPAPPPGNDGSAAEPLFASDEEALEAAAAAYRAYYAVVDQILNDGGANPERLRDISSDNIYALQSEGFRSYFDDSYRSVGETTIDSPVLQKYLWPVGSGEILVSIYACLDFSMTDVVDRNGDSVVEPNRQARYPMEVSFAQSTGIQNLIITEEDSWTGTNFCV